MNHFIKQDICNLYKIKHLMKVKHILNKHFQIPMLKVEILFY